MSGTQITIPLDVCSAKGKTWLARITGADEKYGLAREFVKVARGDDNRSRSGMTGSITYRIGDGVYEGNEPRSGKWGRFFIVVSGGRFRLVEKDEALAALDPQPAA